MLQHHSKETTYHINESMMYLIIKNLKDNKELIEILENNYDYTHKHIYECTKCGMRIQSIQTYNKTDKCPICEE